jgi:heat shock protein HslJ
MDDVEVPMRKFIGLFLSLVVSVGLAACSAPSAAPTSAPTAAPTAQPRPTQSLVSNPQSGGTDLGSGAWKWTQAVSAAGASTTVSNGDQFTLQFDASNGRVALATPCQSVGGTYTVNGPALKLNLDSMTNAICPGDTLSGQFIAQAAAVQSYSLDGGDLVLKLSGDGGTLRLAR